MDVNRENAGSPKRFRYFFLPHSPHRKHSHSDLIQSKHQRCDIFVDSKIESSPSFGQIDVNRGKKGSPKHLDVDLFHQKDTKGRDFIDIF